MMRIEATAVAVGILAMSCAVATASGQTSPYAFGGTYDIAVSSVTEDQANVTLTVTIFNHSGAVVNNATIHLEDSERSDVNYGSLGAVMLLNGGSKVLRGSFAISRREFERWSHGRTPSICIHVPDGSGVRRRNVELVPKR